MKRDINILAVGALVLAVVTAVEARPLREWSWAMPTEVYKDLDFTDRAGVDRANRLFGQAVGAEDSGMKSTDLVPRYRAAAVEWRKVQIKGESGEDFNAPLLAWAVFMQGYAYHQAHDRGQAKKLYEEVLDLYNDQKFAAIPARYLLSKLDRELGETRKADEAVREIVDDKGAEGHPLYWFVLRDLINIHWSKFEVEETVELCEKLFWTKQDINWNFRRLGYDILVTYHLAECNMAEYEKLLLNGIPDKNVQRRGEAFIGAAEGMVGFLHGATNGGVSDYLARKYPPDKKKKQLKDARAKVCKEFLAWFDGHAAEIGEMDDGWRLAIVNLHLHVGLDSADVFAKRFQQLLKLVKGAPEGKHDARAIQLKDELLGHGQPDTARTVMMLIKNPITLLRQRWAFETDHRVKGDMKVATELIEELCNQKPALGDLLQLKYARAWHYHHRLNNLEKTIKYYLDIDDPPRSLWCLAGAYRDAGKKPQGYQTLTEIASIFPNEAPQAILTRAGWYEADGEKKKAIADYRSLLANPKWKELGQSSAAHQALERMGIATGGAMTNEVR